MVIFLLFISLSFAVEFSPEQGKFDDAFDLRILSDGEAYYTLDGSEPSSLSLKYKAPINIVNSTVVRVLSGGKVSNGTFLVREQSNLPIVSVISDPKNLWDDKTGILVEGSEEKYGRVRGRDNQRLYNFYEDWERPAHISFFVDGKMEFSENAGIKVNGASSRELPQKSLKVRFKKKYGKKPLNFALFPDDEPKEFYTFVLRNSGNDWGHTMKTGGMVSQIIQGRANVDSTNYRPAFVYLNGKPYGIENIREKADKKYVKTHYPQASSIDLLKFNPREIVEKSGSKDSFLALKEFLRDSDLSRDENYSVAKEKIAIEKFIDYNIIQIYLANTDWPANNVRIFKIDEGPFHWVFFDADMGLGFHPTSTPETNMFEHAIVGNRTKKMRQTSKEATLVLRKLLENDEFRNKFLLRFMIHLNTTFSSQRVKTVMDRNTQYIEGDIGRHFNLWAQETQKYLRSKERGPDHRDYNMGNLENFYKRVSIQKDFVERRPRFIEEQIMSFFNFEEMVNLKVGGPFVTIDGIKVENFNANIVKGLSLNINYNGDLGNFMGWNVNGVFYSPNSEIKIVLKQNTVIDAVISCPHGKY